MLQTKQNPNVLTWKALGWFQLTGKTNFLGPTESMDLKTERNNHIFTKQTSSSLSFVLVSFAP